MATDEACHNCKNNGAEWVRRRSAGEPQPFNRKVDKSKRPDMPHYWSSCRALPPEMSSTWVGQGPLGEAWMGVHPWVPYDHWCASYTVGEDSTAATIEFGSLKLRDKQPKE
jgi:hypothetical protein